MRSTAPMRTAKIGYISVSALMVLLGLALIIFPEISVSVLETVCGILFIVFGVIKLVGFFSKDLYRLAFQYDLVFGILMIVLGITMLVHPGSLANFICIALGVSILIDGLFRVQTSVEAKRFGIRTWWLIAVCGILAAVGALVLMFRPVESAPVLMVLVGISLVLEGILNLITVIVAVRIFKNQQPDVIYVEPDESEENRD
ncbi:MAG: DUF308 domain-containing protein [Eubacteriales bacterium]|nr:DUF308 domain-containing protein [Eubacteriales bacterium]